MLRLPRAIGTMIGVVADVLGWLGWRSPARSTAMAQLAHGVDRRSERLDGGDRDQAENLDEFLSERTQQACRSAGLRGSISSKPLAIVALALFWIATGIVALGPGRAAALAHLDAAGFTPSLAEPLRIWGSVFDILLGALLLVRRLARPVLMTMLAVTPIYLLVGTITAPQLWVDPLGPFLKIVPMLAATMFTLAILDER